MQRFWLMLNSPGTIVDILARFPFTLDLDTRRRRQRIIQPN